VKVLIADDESGEDMVRVVPGKDAGS